MKTSLKDATLKPDAQRALAHDIENLKFSIVNAVERLAFKDEKFIRSFGCLLYDELTYAIERRGHGGEEPSLEDQVAVLRDPCVAARLVRKYQELQMQFFTGDGMDWPVVGVIDDLYEGREVGT